MKTKTKTNAHEPPQQQPQNISMKCFVKDKMNKLDACDVVGFDREIKSGFVLNAALKKTHK